MAAYIFFDGVKGASDRKGYTDWIEISGFQYGITKSGASGVGTKRNEGTNVFMDMTVNKLADKSSPKILEKMCAQERYKEVKIHVLQASNGDQPYLEFTLGSVMVCNYSLSGFDQTTAQESLSLNFTTIKQKAFAFDKDGKRDSGIEFAYDVDKADKC